jgi:Ulp1 family protease
MPKKKVITIDLCEDNETCEDIKTPIDKNKFIFDIHNDKVVLVWPFRPIADVRQVTIHNGDAFRIVNNEWLNDSFIEFGVWHFLLDRCSNREKAANVHYFDPMFLTQLKKHSLLHPSERYQILKKMANGRLVFKKKVLIFPVNHKNIHWYMIAMLNPSSVCVPENSKKSGSSKDNAQPCFIILDSSAGRKCSRSYKENIELLKDYIVCEWLERGCTALQVRMEQVSFNSEIRKWVGVPVVLISTPQQPNSYDCGVYTIRNIRNVIEYLQNVTKEDVKQKFLTCPQLVDYHHNDIIDDRIELKVLIDSLIPEYYDTVFPITISPIYSHPPSSKLLFSLNRNEPFIHELIEVLLQPNIITVILEFLYDGEVAPDANGILVQDLLIQASVRFHEQKCTTTNRCLHIDM